MQPFSIVFLALSFLSSTFCRVLLPPSSNSSVVSVDPLDVPVRPAQALANINVEFRNELSDGSFDPAQLYYNIHAFLVSFWRTPHIQPITQAQTWKSFPSLVTQIVPALGSNLFTTAVVAAVLSDFLVEIPELDWRPRHLAARLTTRTAPPREIGRISSGCFPERRLDASTNSTSSPESRICKDKWVAVSREVRLRLEFDGNPEQPPIDWAVWLEQLTGISSQIFANHSPQEELRLPLPLTKIFNYRQTIGWKRDSWTLESEVDVTRVPQGKEPLSVDELVQALTEMLKAVANGRCYTQLRAVIVKEDQVAATYKLSYTADPRNIDTA
ncbi:hypothetical protein G7Y79_00014g037590 [Physcia stellaris]|nr:hypothetical protein G7Y79_00014g037590 [Physcia stellaris]